MSALKYEKYIVDSTQIPESVKQKDPQGSKSVVWLDKRIIDGAFILNLIWFTEPFTGIDTVGDWQNPRELNGEIEFWLEDEKYILTKSCVVFVPKGLIHCPLKVLRVDRPIIHFHAGPTSMYTRAG